MRTILFLMNLSVTGISRQIYPFNVDENIVDMGLS